MITKRNCEFKNQKSYGTGGNDTIWCGKIKSIWHKTTYPTGYVILPDKNEININQGTVDKFRSIYI